MSSSALKPEIITFRLILPSPDITRSWCLNHFLRSHLSVQISWNKRIETWQAYFGLFHAEYVFNFWATNSLKIATRSDISTFSSFRKTKHHNSSKIVPKSTNAFSEIRTLSYRLSSLML